jgi:hypothetical protein
VEFGYNRKMQSEAESGDLASQLSDERGNMKGMSASARAARYMQDAKRLQDEANAVRGGYFYKDIVAGGPARERVRGLEADAESARQNAQIQNRISMREGANRRPGSAANDAELRDFINQAMVSGGSRQVSSASPGGDNAQVRNIRETGDGGRVITLILPPSQMEHDLNIATRRRR